MAAHFLRPGASDKPKLRHERLDLLFCAPGKRLKWRRSSPWFMASIDSTSSEINRPSARRRVLVADDYPDTAESLAILLSDAGFDVRTARDGEQARELVSEWDPDACVLDLSMPALGGCDLARWIHRHCGAQRPLLVAFTGWTRTDDQSRAREAGFDVHFMKPAEPAEILRVLENAVTERGRSNAPV
jgi:CheY-like chemotaxis protein